MESGEGRKKDVFKHLTNWKAVAGNRSYHSFSLRCVQRGGGVHAVLHTSYCRMRTTVETTSKVVFVFVKRSVFSSPSLVNCSKHQSNNLCRAPTVLVQHSAYRSPVGAHVHKTTYGF
jgi:hypothetical protein